MGPARDGRERLLLRLPAEDWPPARPTATTTSSSPSSTAGVKGLIVVGQNPAVGSANARKVQAALAKLDWLVVSDLFQNETSEFWKLEGMNPAEIQTEVIMLPAAGPLEKEGSFTNTHRLIQWKHKMIEPMGESHSDGWYMVQIGKRLKKLYEGSTEAKDLPIKHLVWDYDDPQQPGRVRPHQGAEGDQRLRRDHRRAGLRLRGPEGRRHHGLRLLDLLRHLPRGGRQQGRRPAAGGAQPARRLDRGEGGRLGRLPAPGLGLRLACQPAGHLQPGLRGPAGPALVEGAAGLVGRGRAEVGRRGRARHAARRARCGARPERPRRHAVHHEALGRRRHLGPAA